MQPKLNKYGIKSARQKNAELIFEKLHLIRMSISHVILMSILKWQVNSSSLFVSFFIVMTHNSSVNLKLIRFLLLTKGSHEIPNFDTFQCSGKNLPNSSCHFSNHKSGFLQILHHSSVSWKITLLYFFRSNIKYFTQ